MVVEYIKTEEGWEAVDKAPAGPGTGTVHVVPIVTVPNLFNADEGGGPHTAMDFIDLGTSLAPVPGSRFRLVASDWDLGENPLYRLICEYGGGTANPNTGDVLEAQAFDAVGGVPLVTATKTVEAPGGANVISRVATAWTAVPESVKYGYLMHRNQTGARGALLSARFEVRYS